MLCKFFPRNREFWLYHGCVLVGISVITIMTILLWSDAIAVNILGTATFLPLFTLTVLYFRWLYKTTALQSLSMAKLVPVIITYGTVFGFLVAAIIDIVVLLPFFWNEIFSKTTIINSTNTAFNVMVRFVIVQGLQFQLFICLWIFTYHGITTNRKMKEAELRYLRSQNKLKEASLSNLTNQLNPHFLFNALNNIRFMIHENSDSADKMITSLSDILRYSLESSKQEKVYLSQEIEIIERYIAIVKTHLEDRLHFSMSILPIHYTCLIPPMALQMLIENAVKHGLDHIRHGGKLVISSYEKENKLIVIVTNDLPKRPSTPIHNTGIGLNNIKQRLHLLYGDDAELTFSRTDNQFSVQMLLPKE